MAVVDQRINLRGKGVGITIGFGICVNAFKNPTHDEIMAKFKKK
jgi:hypothetical protein